MVTGAEMLPLIVGQAKSEENVFVDDSLDMDEADIIDEATANEPEIENVFEEAEADPEPAAFANADAPPPDYEVLRPDESKSDQTAQKETT